MQYDHKDYMRDNSELWAIVDRATETVASATWWNDKNGIRESRHIVTNPLYFCSGLVTTVNFISQALYEKNNSK